MNILIDSKDIERLIRDNRWNDLPINIISDTTVHYDKYTVILTPSDCNDLLTIRLVYRDDIERILKTLTDEQLAQLGLARD